MSGLVDAAEEAFAAYRSGDEQRMGELVELLTPVLWHAARAAGAGPDEAQDAVQTTWVALVRHADSIRDPRAVLAWLLTTVRRRAIDAARRDREVVLDLTEQRHEQPDPAPEPSAQVELGDRQRILWRHVEALGDRCRQLLRIVAFAQRPDYDTIAQELGMPVGSIGPTRGRCLAKLRTLLAADPGWAATTWEGALHV